MTRLVIKLLICYKVFSKDLLIHILVGFYDDMCANSCCIRSSLLTDILSLLCMCTDYIKLDNLTVA